MSQNPEDHLNDRSPLGSIIETKRKLLVQPMQIALEQHPCKHLLKDATLDKS